MNRLKFYRRVNLNKVWSDSAASNIKQFDVADVHGADALPEWKRVLLDSLSFEFSVRIKIECIPDAMKGFYGYCQMSQNTITIFDAEISTKNWWVSVLYHELGHILCYRTGRYKSVHTNVATTKRQHLRVVLKAERYVDALGFEMVKRRHPEVKYQFSYEAPEDIELLKTFYWG